MVVVSVHARLARAARRLAHAAARRRRRRPTRLAHADRRFGITDKFAGARFGRSYGCCVLVLSAIQTHLPRGWTGGTRLGRHAPGAPASLGRGSSAGCVRLAERPLRTLMRRLPLGAPVII